MKDIKDPRKFDEIKKAAQTLAQSGTTRNQEYQKAEDMYFLKWTDQPKDASNLKITISPDGRDKAQGVARLLSAADPIPTVTREGLDTDQAGHIENALIKMWDYSGLTNGGPVHYDAALSAALYSAVSITCVLTSEILKFSKGTSPAAVRRAEMLAEKTPILFRAMPVKNVFPEYDELGMSGYYVKSKTTLGQIRRLHGNAAARLQGNDRDAANLSDYWDLTYHAVFVDGSDTPILFQEHELPFIPVTYEVAEGSRLFLEPEKRVQPFLYGLYTSGIWNQQNLALTTIYTKLAQTGSMAPVIYEAGPGGETVEMDYSGPIPIWTVPNGAKAMPLNFSLLDPNIYRALDIANNLAQEATIFGQTLGSPIGGGAAFSTVAMLSQAGRLPLVGAQRAVSNAIAGIMQLSLEWLGIEGVKHKQLKEINLTERFEVSINLDVKLPQDFAKNAGLANQITSPGNQLVSKAWALENLLQITDPDGERRKILAEQAYMARFAQRMQQVMAAQNPRPPAPNQPQPGSAGPQMTQPPDQTQGAPAPDGSLQGPLDPNAQAGPGLASPQDMTAPPADMGPGGMPQPGMPQPGQGGL